MLRKLSEASSPRIKVLRRKMEAVLCGNSSRQPDEIKNWCRIVAENPQDEEIASYAQILILLIWLNHCADRQTEQADCIWLSQEAFRIVLQQACAAIDNDNDYVQAFFRNYDDIICRQVEPRFMLTAEQFESEMTKRGLIPTSAVLMVKPSKISEVAKDWRARSGILFRNWRARISEPDCLGST